MALAARRVTHEDCFAVAHDDSSMKHVEILARGHKKNQVTALQICFEPWRCPLRYTFHASPLRIESGHNIQNALPAEYRDRRHRNRLDYPFAYIIANPARHIVIAP